MLSVALCRCSQPLRLAPSKLLTSGAQTRVLARQLITSTRYTNKGFGLKGFRKVLSKEFQYICTQIRELVKSNGILARFCANAPKPNPPKAVGYWLLGCSGMVFTAVVLGMVGGYLVLLYSVYYVLNLILSSTNGSK